MERAKGREGRDNRRGKERTELGGGAGEKENMVVVECVGSE